MNSKILALLSVWLAIPVSAQFVGGPSNINSPSAASTTGVDAGEDANLDDLVVSTIRSTGTAPNSTVTGEVNKGSHTVHGDLRVDGSGLFGSTVNFNGGIGTPSLTASSATLTGASVVQGPWTVKTGTVTIRPASTEPQLHLQQSNGDDGWRLHADANVGALTFFRRESAVDAAKVFFKADGKVRIGDGNTPLATLDVGGSAMFGSGGTQSTFTTTGALTLPSGSQVTARGGITTSSATFTGPVLMASGSDFTTRGSTISIRPATDVAQLHLQQNNGTDGWKFHADAGVGDLAFQRFESGSASEKVRVTANGGWRLYSRTIAQLLAITPGAVGETFFCNNCSPTKVVVSTGTGPGNFAASDGGSFQ